MHPPEPTAVWETEGVNDRCLQKECIRGQEGREREGGNRSGGGRGGRKRGGSSRGTWPILYPSPALSPPLSRMPLNLERNPLGVKG